MIYLCPSRHRREAISTLSATFRPLVRIKTTLFCSKARIRTQNTSDKGVSCRGLGLTYTRGQALAQNFTGGKRDDYACFFIFLLFLIIHSATSFIVFRLNILIIGTREGLCPYSKGIYSIDALTP